MLSEESQGIIKMIAYIVSALLLLSLVISILVMDSKMHNKMFDDNNNVIRTDTYEGNLTIAFITIISYIAFKFISMTEGFSPITNIIPDYAKLTNVPVEYYNGAIEILAFTAVIVGMNFKYHDRMFDDVKKRVKVETPEGIATICFISFIAFVVFYFVVKYLSEDYTVFLEPINSVMYNVVLIFSIVIWLLSSIASAFDSSSDSKSIFDDFSPELFPSYGLLFFVILIISFVLYKAAYDPKALTTNTFVYISMIALFILFALFYSYPIIMANSGTFVKMSAIGLLAIVLIGIVYFYINMNSSSFEITSYLTTIVLVLIVIVGLALSFYLLSNYLKTFTGWPGFIIYFIFYIPCLLIDFAKYILKEFRMTSRVIYILFFIELLLILVYVYVPKIIKAVDKKDGITLVDNGEFLDRRLTIGTSKLLQIPTEQLKVTNIPIVYNKNFTFSMWIYLNIQPSNFGGYSRETSIFDLGNSKPKIVYYNDLNSEVNRNKYIVYFTDSKTEHSSYEVTLPNQKWNNFVLSYKSNQVDLFINGELVKIFKFTDNQPQYKPTDIITVGSDKGLDGAICNVRYYPTNLAMSRITSMYNVLMYKNPPVM